MSSTVYISGFQPSATEEELKNLFSFCGPLKETSLSPTCFTATFDQESSVATALLLDQAALHDRTIRVSTSMPGPSAESEKIDRASWGSIPPPLPSYNYQPQPIHYPYPHPYNSPQSVYQPVFISQPPTHLSTPAKNPAFLNPSNDTLEANLSNLLRDELNQTTIHTPGAIYLTGLTPSVTNDQLLAFFRFCGEIKRLERNLQQDDGYIIFASQSYANLASQMNGAELSGAQIGVATSGTNPQLVMNVSK